jgi:hypothetical protein
MPVSFAELQDAFLFTSFGAPGENEAYLATRANSISIPHTATTKRNCPKMSTMRNTSRYLKNDLGLGASQVFAFVREFLSDDYDEVRRIFRRRGAYGRYKAMLARRGALDRWYGFANKAEESALGAVCKNGIELSDYPGHGVKQLADRSIRCDRAAAS